MARSVNKDIADLRGAKELNALFAAIPKELNKEKIWTKLWKENSKPVVSAAQANARFKGSNTGQLKDSIGFFTTKRSRELKGGYVGPKVKGKYASIDKSYDGGDKKRKYGKSGFYGAFVEFGGEVKFWGKGRSKFGNQPFMKPAFDQTKNIVISNALKDGAKIIAKVIKSHEK